MYLHHGFYRLINTFIQCKIVDKKSLIRTLDTVDESPVNGFQCMRLAGASDPRIIWLKDTLLQSDAPFEFQSEADGLPATVIDVIYFNFTS